MATITVKRFEDMSLPELRDELAYWERMIRAFPAWGSGINEARIQRDLCTGWIAQREGRTEAVA